MDPETFNGLMEQQPCAVCGSIHEPSYVRGEKVYQGGVLTQMVSGAVNGEEGMLVLHKTVCSSCLGDLQMLADYRGQQEVADALPEDEVADVMTRLKQPHPEK